MMTPDEMAALHAQCFVTPRPWLAADFADLLQSPLVFALTEPGALLLGRVVAGEAELLTLAVTPARRGQGIASALVAAFLAKARSLGAESAFLEVSEDNALARRLYAGHGFAKAGLRRAYYRAPDGTAQDALVLVRQLTEPTTDQS